MVTSTYKMMNARFRVSRHGQTVWPVLSTEWRHHDPLCFIHSPHAGHQPLNLLPWPVTCILLIRGILLLQLFTQLLYHLPNNYFL